MHGPINIRFTVVICLMYVKCSNGNYVICFKFTPQIDDVEFRFMCCLSILYKAYNEIVTLKDRAYIIVPFVASAKGIRSIIREINLHQSLQCCCLWLKLIR